MKLSLIYETFGTGAIAMRPLALGRESKPRRAEDKKDDKWYLKYSKKQNVQMNDSK